MLDAGIIVMDKPSGFTSFDVIGKLRGILHTRKMGHTGTLDPIATGVLVVCVGRATKLVSKLTAEDKIYEAGILFGEKRDTGDITGKVIETSDREITAGELNEAAAAFTGDIDQIPPMYSAKKVNGKRLYEYAREGIEVEREPEHIHIFTIELLDFSYPHAKILVHCSKGTYIRTLIEDISEKAGTYGTMESLRRLKNGDFSIDEAVTFEELEAAEDPWELVHPVEV
ncbi:MAG: tRNA pseudouridine(55) synthase TruB [Lachnospiraceae bacterium]|uniref:tRNA pseudouridine synthase B n=1 Tax=Candidatus Weimeria bifida TaxID=2599074 RepID=A0A6N7IWI5_9FIRM|nr:tRNA pseudouridine(55) synthase TruB [Candidatus Weimeria bifida]RRF96030.1 MAG: tRNA pseudouridine(55) synthase TruB [Lachnospiraceae bacterium]